MTDEEKEKLWINKLDKQERWVLGQRVSIAHGYESYYNHLESAQGLNRRLGYGTSEVDWKRKVYEEERRELNIKKRLFEDLEKIIDRLEKEEIEKNKLEEEKL